MKLYCLILKSLILQIINYIKSIKIILNNLNFSIIMYFIDATDAFYGVNHVKMFTKMVERGVPVCIVRVLAYWYADQTVQVKSATHSL